MFFGIKDLKNVCPLRSSFIDDLDEVVSDSKKSYCKAFGKCRLSIFLDKLTIEKQAIDRLGVYFTLPGYPEDEFVPNGKNILLTKSNVEEYHCVRICFVFPI